MILSGFLSFLATINLCNILKDAVSCAGKDNLVLAVRLPAIIKIYV